MGNHFDGGTGNTAESSNSFNKSTLYATLSVTLAAAQRKVRHSLCSGFREEDRFVKR